jgi:hypothetical protein
VRFDISESYPAPIQPVRFDISYPASIQPQNPLSIAMSKEKEKKEEETAACTLGPGDSDLQGPQPTRSRFTKSEKWFIVGFTSFVGLFRQSFIMPGFKIHPN